MLTTEMRDTLVTIADRGGVLEVGRAGHVLAGGLTLDASAATWLRIVAEGWVVGEGHDRLHLTPRGRTMAARCRDLRARAVGGGLAG